MKKIISIKDLDIVQKNFQQMVIRGNGKDDFNQIVNKEISILPPAKNLEIVENKDLIFGKNSFDQWSLIFLVEKNYKDIIKIVSNLNLHENILASDYSYGQVYFEISGKNKIEFLNKLTQFDFREKNFPNFSMAQTLIARIDCSIYHLKEKYIITCNKSFEDYFTQRLADSINL